jgi:hypothetical protein
MADDYNRLAMYSAPVAPVENRLAQAVLPQGHPSNMLMWLRDQIPQVQADDTSTMSGITSRLGRTATAIPRAGLETMSNWLRGTHDPNAVRIGEDTIAPLGLMGMAGLAGRGVSAAAMADNAKSSVPGVVAQGLDMSQEARLARAREQGFDTETTLYHGTRDTFSEFKPRQFAGDGPGVVWMTPNPRLSDYFNGSRFDGNYAAVDGGSTLPLHIRPGNQLSIDAKGADPFNLGAVYFKDRIEEAAALGKGELVAKLRSSPGTAQYADVIDNLKSQKDFDRWADSAEYTGVQHAEGPRARLSAEAYYYIKKHLPEEFDKFARPYNSSVLNATTDVFKHALGGGYDSIAFKNVRDNGGLADQVVVFDPRNIRSTQAAFDPAQRSSANLLAADNARSSVPGTVASASQQPDNAVFDILTKYGLY